MRTPIGFPAILVLGALILAAPGRGPRLAGAGELRVVDFHGRPVGTLLGLADGAAEVLFPAAGAAAGLRVRRDSFVVGGFNAAVFATDDCTGEARLLALDVFLPASQAPIASPAGVLPDNRVIVPTADAPSATTVESIWRPEAVPPCDSSPTGMVPTRPATLVQSEPFQGPFALAERRAGSAAGPGGRAAPVRGVAVDGADEPLGWLGGSAGLPIVGSVLFAVGGRQAPVFMFGNRALFGTAGVVYEANNCTGTPFLFSPDPLSMFPLVGVDVDGVLLREDGPAAPIVVGSESDPLDLVSPCDVVGAGPARPVQATAVLDDLPARPLPFRIALAESPLTGPPGRRGATRRLAVEDATGLPVAVAFTGADSFPGGAVALIQAGSRTGEVLVTGGRFAAGSRLAHFETSACAGPALVRVTNPGEPAPISPPTALGPGDVLYSADGPLDAANLQFRWVPETATCQADPLGPSFVRRTSVLADLSRFALPLAFR